MASIFHGKPEGLESKCAIPHPPELEAHLQKHLCHVRQAGTVEMSADDLVDQLFAVLVGGKLAVQRCHRVVGREILPTQQVLKYGKTSY